MNTNQERFGYDLGPLSKDYDAQLIQDLVTLYATYASYQEYRLMAADFVCLLRLIRANPTRLFEDNHTAFVYINENEPLRALPDCLLPNCHRGVRMRVSSRHPLARLLVTHYPSEHRVWQYISTYKV